MEPNDPLGQSYLVSAPEGEQMRTPAGGNSLRTDFDLMRSVASTTDSRNDEIRSMLQTFIGQMSSVPPSVWGGLAAARFKDVVDRWNAESMRLYQVLHTIAETIRQNEAVLQEAGRTHADHIAAAGGDL
jgi:WXG100 family type VII secretion target